MSLLGSEGLKQLAVLCRDKTEFLKKRLAEIPSIEVMKSSPTFNEFTVKLPVNANEIIGALIEKGIAAGFPLGRYYTEMENYLLIAVTEKRTRHELALFADLLEEAVCS